MSEERQHALLSASTAHRWMTCTPSARLEQMEGQEECSVYAQEGTAAHALAEILLSYKYGKIGPIALQERLNEWHKNEEYEKYYTKEFEEYVNDFVDFVNKTTDEIEGHFDIYFETRVDFSNIVPQGFGTADVLIVTPHMIHVIDLKFGIGVPVSAIDNPQLRLYGMGALNLFPNSDEVRMTIVQPRLDSTSTEVLSKRKLLTWAIEEVKPRADMAIEGKGEFVASDACKFCKLRGKCKARADKQLAIAQAEFAEPYISNPNVPVQELTPEQIGQILDVATQFNSWFKDVQAYALGQLMQGVKIPGYKLVEGRANRIITDEEKVKKILLSVGLQENEIMKPRELLGISKLESLVGKKLFNDLCRDYIVKPSGKLTLAPDDDRRPEANTLDIIKRDFQEPIE